MQKTITFTFAVLSLLFLNSVQAVTTDTICGTESLDSANFVNLPWFENNQFLLNLVDSIENSCTNCRIASDGLSNKKFQVPIKAVIFYNNNYPGITDGQVQQYIREVNRIFEENEISIQFYLTCSVSRYNSINAYVDSESKKDNILSSFLDPNAITVHFVNSTSEDIAPAAAKLPYKWGDKYTLYVETGGGFDQNNANSLAHELGHALGLLHTHDKGKYTDKDNAKCNNCNQESVNKNKSQEWYCWFKRSGELKCAANGDALCDTDADPNWKRAISGNCSVYNYTGTDNDYIVDNYGDAWGSLGYNNAMRNIMSYSSISCRTEFTKMQRGVMYYCLKKSGLLGAQLNTLHFYSNVILDSYEPDSYWFENFSTVYSNKIELSEPQYHTFHHVYTAASPAFSACDVDWVYFENSASVAMPFIIQTSEVSGKAMPDTKITVYNVNGISLGSQIATNDNISSTNLFSKITTANLPANSKFAIKIENNINDISNIKSQGHYYIRVDACFDRTGLSINGSNTLCSTAQTYTISGVPSGATFTWSASPSGKVSITQNGSSCTITRIGDYNGNIVLTASITKCGISYTLPPKTIYVGLPTSQVTSAPNQAIEDDSDCSFPNVQCWSGGPEGGKIWVTSQLSGHTNVTWAKSWSLPAGTSGNIWNSNYSSGTGLNGVHVHFKGANRQMVLKTTISNTCGSIEQYYCFNSNNTICSPTAFRTASCQQYDAAIKGNTIYLTFNNNCPKSEIENIVVTDKMGNVVVEENNKALFTETIQLSIPESKNDIYFVVIQYIDGTIETHSIGSFK